MALPCLRAGQLAFQFNVSVRSNSGLRSALSAPVSPSALYAMVDGTELLERANLHPDIHCPRASMQIKPAILILLLLSGCSPQPRPAAVGFSSTGERNLAFWTYAERETRHMDPIGPQYDDQPPANPSPSIRLDWNHTREQWPIQHIVWQRQALTGAESAIAVVTAPCDATGTNYCLDLPRTNGQAFYRVSAQWR